MEFLKWKIAKKSQCKDSVLLPHIFLVETKSIHHSASEFSRLLGIQPVQTKIRKVVKMLYYLKECSTFSLTTSKLIRLKSQLHLHSPIHCSTFKLSSVSMYTKFTFLILQESLLVQCPLTRSNYYIHRLI